MSFPIVTGSAWASSGPYPSGIYTPSTCKTECLTQNPNCVGFNINTQGNCYCLLPSALHFDYEDFEYTSYIFGTCPACPKCSSKPWKISTLILSIFLTLILSINLKYSIFNNI